MLSQYCKLSLRAELSHQTQRIGQLCLLSDVAQHQSPTAQWKLSTLVAPEPHAAQASRWKHQPLPMIFWAVTLVSGQNQRLFCKRLLSPPSSSPQSSTVSCRPCFICLTYRTRLLNLPEANSLGQAHWRQQAISDQNGLENAAMKQTKPCSWFTSCSQFQKFLQSE